MTDTEYSGKLDELDRLLNDPEVPIQPGRIWSLTDEIASHGPPRDPASRSAASPNPTHGA